MQKIKWLSGEALQIIVKRREAKSKGKKERYKLATKKEVKSYLQQQANMALKYKMKQDKG